MRKISISARLGAKTVFFGGCIALPRSCSGAVVGCMPGVEFAPASSGSR
jgi:hypothetical protein